MRVAIFGCGQLARMMAQAGLPIGLEFGFVAEPDEDTRCVDGLGKVVRLEPGTSAETLYRQLGCPDVVTVEKEQLDVTHLLALRQFCRVHPCPEAIARSQHRGRERALLDALRISCAPYLLGRPDEIDPARIPLPAVIKSCSDGYDGKNQWRLRSYQDLAVLSQLPGQNDYLVEQWIPFERELSQISVRDADGNIKHYPLTENIHQQGILKQSIAPAANVPTSIERLAQDYITRLLEALDYVGVLAMECFVVGDRLLVNELAPRVHNSGHWTQVGSATCQFENHLRAITGLPLGDVGCTGVTGMVNLIGTPAPPQEALAADAWLNWYGKTARPGRKLGHINVVGPSHSSLRRRMARVVEAG